MSGCIAVIICAAGSSNRMGGIKKEFRLLDQLDEEGNPLSVLGSCVRNFTAVKGIAPIVITIPCDSINGEEPARKAIPPYLLNNPSGPKIFFVGGASTRQRSVYNALKFLKPFHPDYVLIHDGARPWVDAELIERVIEGMKQHKAVLPVTTFVETPKEIDDTGFVVRHLKRAAIVNAQTPQGFAFPEILYAHEKALLREQEYTDDAEVWADFIGPVAAVQGSMRNKKITFPEDLPK